MARITAIFKYKNKRTAYWIILVSTKKQLFTSSFNIDGEKGENRIHLTGLFVTGKGYPILESCVDWFVVLSLHCTIMMANDARRSTANTRVEEILILQFFCFAIIIIEIKTGRLNAIEKFPSQNNYLTILKNVAM